MNWEYSENRKQIKLDKVPRSLKKITGTRLASVLGLNPWNTPFQMWCEITKLATLPYEDTIYTIAGKTIEPKQIEWTKKNISKNIVSPEEWFGNRYSEMKYDFYPHVRIYGGMWDAKLLKADNNKEAKTILEFKTTKRASDWEEHPPVYYMVQALLYACLDGCDQVMLICSFLEEDDYNHPENFIVNDSNTKGYVYNVADKNIPYGNDFKSIIELIEMATEWYNNYILKGISPEFDEDKDKEYLAIIRKSKPENDNDLDVLINKSMELENIIDTLKKQNNIYELEKELKNIKEGIKANLSTNLTPTIDKVVYKGYTLSKTSKIDYKVDYDKMKEDKIYDKYVQETIKETLVLRLNKKEED